MATYTIVAPITKADKDNNVQIKGVGKYLYEKQKNVFWNIFEGDGCNTSKFVDLEKSYSLGKIDQLKLSLIGLGLIERKPLKLNIEENGSAYTITAIEVADA